MLKINSLEDLQIVKEKARKALFPSKPRIMVSLSTCGIACGAEEVLASIQKTAKFLKWTIDIVAVGCLGICYKEPVVMVAEPGLPLFIYAEVDSTRGEELVKSLKKGGFKPEWIMARIDEEEIVILGERINYRQEKLPKELQAIPLYSQYDFFRKQLKLVLRNCGFIDPDDIRPYIGRGGYFGLAKALQMKPEEIIEEIKRAGLRGRGGGGFPTARKWESCRKAAGDIKYVICNADEGDPGAYMDRSILEGDPHSVIEGMIIGAYAIGSPEGYIYVRAEYPQAIEKLKIALARAEEYGLLGENILNSGFNFKIKINRGGGAFVCGESTALMASIEGKPGEPRAKYVHTVEKGLWDSPSCLNNVETWNNVPLIMMRGADWYNRIGTEKSKGTKVFSLVGKVNNVGLVEVPMGISLREIVFDIGAGIPQGKRFKALQIGGPSGGCIPDSLCDLPADYERLLEAGSMMGSGGMIVMDETTCMVDVTKYFLEFLRDESCGKCIPCREGIREMYDILVDITSGKAKENDLALLHEISEVVADASLCALGTSAPNSVLTTLKYFQPEYEAHIRERRCPAHVCKALIKYKIIEERCTGCGRCFKACAVEAIAGEKKKPHLINEIKCIKCGQCLEVCKFEAVAVQ